MFLGELQEVIILIFDISKVIVGSGSLQVVLGEEVLVDSLLLETHSLGGGVGQEKGNDCHGGSSEHLIKR